jgi:excisionase family DNA binding protein
MSTQRISNPSHKRDKNGRPPVKKRLYSVQDASTYLGRSVWGVREMLWAGKIPYIKDGRRILIDVRDMRQWIKDNKIRQFDG